MSQSLYIAQLTNYIARSNKMYEEHQKVNKTTVAIVQQAACIRDMMIPLRRPICNSILMRNASEMIRE